MRTLAFLTFLGGSLYAQLERAPVQLPAAAADDETWGALVVKLDTLFHQGHYQAAYDFAPAALREAERFGSDGVRVGLTLSHIGLVCHSLGRYPEAERAYLRAIRILEDDTGQRLVFARAQHNLSTLYMEYGRYRQAEPLIHHALEIVTALLGSDHPDVGGILSNLASAHMMQNRMAEALAEFARALAILEKSPTGHAPNTASVLSNLGYLTLKQGNPLGAIAYLKRSISLYDQTLGPAHPEVVTPLLNLGRVYLALNRAAMAEEALRRAATVAETMLGGEHPLLGEVLSSYSAALRRNGRKREAREMETRAKAILAADPCRTAEMTVHVADLAGQSLMNSNK